MTRRGQVKIVGRGFHQDASEAMRGDIVRGMIELITNSDDAYGDDQGKILIEVEHRRRGSWTVIVRDRARGMRATELEQKLAHAGGRTSGFEAGEAVRGNLGRGAKDVAAFGEVTFESIKENYYSKLTLNQSGLWELSDERRASPEVRERLKIPRGGGTTVTVRVAEHIRCPRHESLVEKLPRHYQLRGIITDPRREVLLANINSGDTRTLRYSEPSRKVVFEGEIPIDGYPDATAQVTIYRNPERLDDAASDPFRPGGLLVRGRRAYYENTLFEFESNPHAKWFSGAVYCPFIDALARDYDDRWSAGQAQALSNPIPIIKRGRDGLQESHPFHRALARAVEVPLGRLVEEEHRRAESSGSCETAETRRCLDALGRDLARLMSEDLAELDEELLPGVDIPPIRLVPGQPVLYLGEDKTVTAIVRGDLGLTSVNVDVDPEGVVEVLGTEVPLQAHQRRQDLLVASVQVRPLLEGETLLSVSCGSHSAVALLEVRPERVLEPVPVEQPETLEFERDSYRITWRKSRRLRIQAPPELVAEHGKDARVLSSDPGVIVAGGLVELLTCSRNFGPSDMRESPGLRRFDAQDPIQGRADHPDPS